MWLEHINNLTGVPRNPPSRTLGPNKQPSADKLFPPRSSKQAGSVWMCMRGCSSRARVLHQAGVRGIYTSFPSPSHAPGRHWNPSWVPPLNTHTPTVECIYHCTPALCTSVLILTLCSRPCLPARGPDQVLALAWVVGWGGRGGLGALKLSSGAPTALPAHPSWPASPQIDSSALLIRSLVTVGGRVCVWMSVCGQEVVLAGGYTCVFLSIFTSLAVHHDCLSRLYFSASFSLAPRNPSTYHLLKTLRRLFLHHLQSRHPPLLYQLSLACSC